MDGVGVGEWEAGDQCVAVEVAPFHVDHHLVVGVGTFVVPEVFWDVPDLMT